MTLAATAPVDNVTNATAAWVVLALLAVFAICATLWHHERVSDRQAARIDTHDEQLAELAYQMPALLEWLGIEIPPPVEDDSPDAMAEEDATYKSGDEIYRSEPDDCPADEIPIAPPTVPDGMPLAVQSALIEQPSPVPRGKSAEWVEAEIAALRSRNAERMARAVTEEAS